MKVEFLNYLHKISIRLRGIALLVFLMTLGLVSFASNHAYGQGVVPVVQTPVRVLFDNQQKTFVATQNTVEGALNQAGIILTKNDITTPPRDAFLNGSKTEITVTRALPVLVSDGTQEQLYYSAYTEPADILRQLDIPVYPEDKINTNLIMDPVDENSVGQKISITRAPTFTVNVDDGPQVVRSWAGTIKDVLIGKINLGVNDIINPPLNSSPVGVNEITITRVNVAETEETEEIPFETVYQNDYNTYQGQTKLIQAGANGEKKLQIQLTYHNGAVVDRTILSSAVTVPVQNKIIGKGVKPYSHQDLWNIMLQAQAIYGVDPSAMFSVMMCESGGNVTSGAGSAHQGLFQWDGSFYKWAADAGVAGDIFNPTSQIMATADRVASSGGWGAWSCKP